MEGEALGRGAVLLRIGGATGETIETVEVVAMVAEELPLGPCHSADCQVLLNYKVRL